jgi:hypothetical protein
MKQINASQLNESQQLVGVYVVYEIIKKLTVPFNQTEAFRLGIIDQDGNVLRKRRTLKTRQEQNAYTVLDTLVFNIKKMIEKLPGGKTRLASYISALFLIKESKNLEVYEFNNEMLEEELHEFLNNFEITENTKKELELVDMAEDIANVGGAGVATDIPFKPRVKTKPEELLKRFTEMYEECCGADPVLFKKIEKRKEV